MTPRVVLCCLLAAVAAAAEPARAVPAPVAELLRAAAAAEPAEVVRLVDGWTGDAHALLHLVRGQARLRLAQDAADAGRGEGLAGAERDFRAALGLDATLRQAHLGLAQVAAARDDWAGAARSAGAGIDPATADAALIAFLADCGLRAGDWRLATIAAQHGIMRFPDDQALRRIELAALVHAGRAEDARQALLALLARDAGDADLWRRLAWSAQETGRDDELLAALEAVVAVAPADRDARRRLAGAQLARELPHAALATVRPLIGEPPSAEALADAGLILLASRAAAGADEPALARAWVDAVPEAAATRDLRLQRARLAVQAGDAAAAGAALDALVALGERDGAVLAWAGSLAEGRGEPARAEALYLRAAAGEDAAAAPATLRLAALYLKQERRDEAATLLAAYLSRHPGDAQARALHALVERRRP